MTALQALADGIRRVNRAPAILACVFLVTLLAALPAALTLRDSLRAHLGGSLAADEAARGVNYQWWTEYAAQSDGIARTFTATIVGFAAVLDNLSTLLDANERPTGILWLGAAYLLLWLFLSGGILDRYARNRPTRSYEFFTACGVFFVRFLRLAPFMAAAYYLLFRYVHRWLFGTLYGGLTHDVTVERTAALWRLAFYALFVLLLAFVNVVFDYAKVRAVVEDRRSMIGSLAASLRFIRRNIGGVAALYAADALIFLGIVCLYAAAAPGARPAGPQFWLGFLISQAYLLARTWARLVFFASEVALFQGRLAYAGYVARAAVREPEPPAVEQLLRQ